MAYHIISQAVIENAIIEIVIENDDKGRPTGLGEIGSRLQKKYSDFDVRNYGYSSLSTFIEEIDNFDLQSYIHRCSDSMDNSYIPMHKNVHNHLHPYSHHIYILPFLHRKLNCCSNRS
jgi:hypothetical protein